MKNGLIYLLLILSGNALYGQNKLYLGFDFGIKEIIYQEVDSAGGIETPNIMNIIGGVNLAYEFNERFRIESGLYYHPYDEGFKVKGDFSYGISSSINAVEIPLRLKSKFTLIKNKLFILGSIGYAYVKNLDYDPMFAGYIARGYGGGSSSSGSYSNRYSYQSYTSFVKHFSLIHAGLSLELNVFKGGMICFSTGYNTGFKKVIQMNVEYQINNQPFQKAVVFTNGDYFNFMFGIKYPISNIWQSGLNKAK